MQEKTIIVSVTSDLCTDQRVHRTAITLHLQQYHVIVVGRKLPTSFDIKQPYVTKRFKLWFTSGALFYITYQLRLFWFLLFTKADLLFANDLDTLLPNYLVSKLKNIPIVFDSHEYYTGVPELENRPFIKNIWKSVERFIVPRLAYTITVNESIANLFYDEYKNKFAIVRNIPLQPPVIKVTDIDLFKKENNIPADKFVIILQGNGINVHRGAEELVAAMEQVQNAVLIIAGNGDVIELLMQMVSGFKLHDKVIFKPRMQYDVLMQYTQIANLGISFDKPTNINYLYSLPNKLFDYLHAHTPILASNLPELKKIIEQYNIGYILLNIEANEIANTLNKIINDTELLKQKKNNTYIAAEQLTWEHEKIALVQMVNNALRINQNGGANK
ncbi:MAG: glycosyltransferase [Bacteroidetes bacterium]|nr:glycosyltransferase [Bacteroidota bacterium]MBL0053884.1 glycosyltransferase [Bacteroidota bacterium]